MLYRRPLRRSLILGVQQHAGHAPRPLGYAEVTEPAGNPSLPQVGFGEPRCQRVGVSPVHRLFLAPPDRTEEEDVSGRQEGTLQRGSRRGEVVAWVGVVELVELVAQPHDQLTVTPVDSMGSRS